MGDQKLKLWGAGFRVTKVKLVAAFAGVHVEQQLTFTSGVTNRTPQFLTMNDRGKVCSLSSIGTHAQVPANAKDCKIAICGAAGAAADSSSRCQNCKSMHTGCTQHV